jgi:type IV conjugative transfer system lipoprotein TraV
MQKFLVLTLITVLTSCSSNVKGSWSCPLLEGGKGSCVSIAEADDFRLADSKNTTLPESYFDKQQKIEIKLVAPKLKDLQKLTATPTSPQINLVRSSPQLRTEEKVGKIWFSPYIDSDGNQHSESVIYVVDEKPKWISQK